jgi:putative nucleotidyltransferase with HDIG domain
VDRTLSLEPSLVGRVIANHRLVTELGSGGMGKVFFAEHLTIGRRAAIKVLNPEVARDPGIVSRFLNEARAVNEIRHPNVVEITDMGHEGDLHYIVMQFLEGETLGERLERSKVLDEPTTLRIARQVTSALGAAHQQDIVHRDLKPDNIFITSHPDFPDYVKVLDFGIAKLKAAPGGNPGLTKAGTVLGTPLYMSPEQCRGSVDVDARSDVYSLAVVLYQCLTGKLPFVSPQIMEIMIAHATQPPVAPSEHNPALAPHLNAAILRAMEKDPAKRFASMRELWAALAAPPAAAASAAPEKATGTNHTAHDEPAPAEESAEAKGVRGVADKLTAIIDARLQGDRLVVPTMPAIAVECLKVIRDPRQTFKSVGDVIAKDPVLSSRVLKLANSAAFPGLSAATTLETAIARMGIEGLTVVLVQYSVHQAFTSRDERIRNSFRGIWQHSLGVALLAKDLAIKLTPAGPEPNAAYLAGLLHDVGKPVVASLLLEAEKQISQGRSNAWFDESIWRKIVNESHRKVGVMLARKWNLPDEVVKTIEDCKAYEKSTPRSCANVVRLSNALAKRAGLYVGETSQAEIDRTVEAGQLIVGLGADTVNKICKDIYARVGTMLDSSAAKAAVARK